LGTVAGKRKMIGRKGSRTRERIKSIPLERSEEQSCPCPKKEETENRGKGGRRGEEWRNGGRTEEEGDKGDVGEGGGG